MSGLYIHIPFCEQICSYCDFAVLKAPDRMHSEYVAILKKEFQQRPWASHSGQTLYFGGGTPSILSLSHWEELFSFLPDSFDEITVEVNPESFSIDKALYWKERGVSRLSIGLQTLDNTLLGLLKRGHKADDGLAVLREARNMGFACSADLIFGLPTQNVEDFLRDLETILQTGVEHVSFYGLTVEPNTLFAQWEQKQKVDFSDDAYEEMYERGVELASKYGLLRYEISNFAKPGFESKHNSSYWNHVDYQGYGPGAHGLQQNIRYSNPRKFKDWKTLVLEEHGLPEKEVLSENTLEWERIWLSLRQEKGCKVLPKTFTQKFSEKLEHREGAWHLHGRGWLDLDLMMEDLL